VFLGAWSDVLGDVVRGVGITPEISAAVAVAMASPTIGNIRRVEQAYQEAGLEPPPALLNRLYERYYSAGAGEEWRLEAYRAGGLAKDYWPWLIGAALLFFMMRRK
jgi:hypothetical protein